MPGVYKLKTCPNCGKEHRRRGPNCSISCGNAVREITDEHRANQSRSQKAYAETPEGIAHYQMVGQRSIAKSIGENALSMEDYLIDIPSDDELDQDERINW
jgi:hypothetical protein